MLEGKHHPQGSLNAVKKLGVELNAVGCCCAPVKDGHEHVVRGCDWYDYRADDEMGRPVRKACPWREQRVKMKADGTPSGQLERAPAGESTVKNIHYRIVKDTGTKIVRTEGYQPCFQFHAQMRDRHGKNGVRIVVRGFDGSLALMPGTERKPGPTPDAPPLDVPCVFEVKVPLFASPGDNMALAGDSYNARLMAESDDGYGRSTLAAQDQMTMTPEVQKDVREVVEKLKEAKPEEIAARTIGGGAPS